ncbi:hypothetical protein LY90DRAFT_664869 [Neocallimastix californiae]|uniref:Uncharacterized protein n=1 Tax=Neocallimastix californiae TaxID=1754190 RepID=A0A1Y2F498_9FUNG|nr:hypothetical protein LY90DRAFT_664869 [Neocallimastix californiae]|eukprot:ORY78692.1 hypothetical protein LY90DRAFT_664869 [Neocallimastix californiae]
MNISNNNNNNNEISKSKRYFPKVGKCICFLSSDKSFKICTSIVMIYYIISLGLYTFIYGFSNVSDSIIYSEIMLLGIVVSHVFLLEGVKKLKSFYMIQFIMFYGIYIIVVILKEISIIMSAIGFKTSENIRESIIFEYQNNNRLYSIISKYKEKQLDEFISSCFKYTIITKIIEIVIMIYYYLVNCSYIEDMIEFVEHEDRFRDINN